MDYFKLIHEEGRLKIEISVDDVVYTKDVTEYFEKHNPHDDWLDYKLGLLPSE